MIYLSGCLPSSPHIRKLLLDNNVGLLLTHVSQRNQPSDGKWVWAADNACFTAQNWDKNAWLRWLESKNDPTSALFATIPDVVGDHAATLKRWPQFQKQVAELGYVPAFILQNGCTANDVPWDECGAVFIGGDTTWKLSEQAFRIVIEARSRGHWVHMGRVNSLRRLQIAQSWGCNSVDGTYLAFGPDVNSIRLIEMMRRIASQPALDMFSKSPILSVGCDDD